MRTDKETKKWFKGIASADPDQYYATDILKREGFKRKTCTRCATFFWAAQAGREVCGDPACAGGFRLFEDNPAQRPLTYKEVWTTFAEHMAERGYRTIPRYPVVARWNPTMEFTIASIAAFQPHVVNGEVDAPAKKLTIPQFCLRFGDIDNVGITGSHLTGFVMIGQHQFVPAEEWDQNRAFEDLFSWFTDVMGLAKEEIVFHEDAWAGGGNYGPCMEFFSRGVELCNQVYMLYEQTSVGDRELSLKVLDLGLGMERCAWFSQGKGTAYDATFPAVVEKLLERTGVDRNEELQQRFLPVAGYLNIDEIDNVEEAWERVATAVGVPVDRLRSAIEPMQAIYCIAEHARALLFALTDGGLPSNVGGGYNLRTIFRRAQGFIEKHSWDLDVGEVATWHAEELRRLFPELQEDIEGTRKILAVELRKFEENKKKTAALARKAAKAIQEKYEFFKDKKEVQKVFVEKLVELYDSQGVDPEAVARELKELGIPDLLVPDNFYKLVSERHERQEQATATRKEVHFPVDDLPRTQLLYFDSYDLVEFESLVVKQIDPRHLVLEKTVFYPTSGGQEHDTGTLRDEDGNEYRIVDVIKQGGVVIHVLAEDVDLSPGDPVHGMIDWERRRQLAQHHTATHVINGAARKVLGNHVWQAGAAKTTEKGRIDLTHYENLDADQVRSIEEEANAIVQANIEVCHAIVPKQEAESRHGFRLYQGGAVPGSEIRVVDIPGFDVEACGGTHLNRTGELGMIRILKSSKVQDGIVRLEYVAGAQAELYERERKGLLEEMQRLLGVDDERLLPSACEELFARWKARRKGKAHEGRPLEPYEDDPLARCSEILKTPKDQLLNTIRKFLRDLEA